MIALALLQEAVQPAEIKISGSAIATVFGVISTLGLTAIAAFKVLGMQKRTGSPAGRRVDDGFTDHDRAVVQQQAVKVDRLTELMVLLTQTNQQQSETQRQLANVTGQQAMLLQTIILKIDDCFPDPPKK